MGTRVNSISIHCCGNGISRLYSQIGIWEQEKAAKVTLSKAAGLAGIDIYDFMQHCKEEQIPVIEVTKEELLEEIES